MSSIYLDHSATTPTDKKVLKEMLPFFDKKFGNASSVHSFGQQGAIAIGKARDQLADFFNCQTSEIYFTSGATESNNLAIFGLINNLRAQNKKIHIITSVIEHDAVLEPFACLEKQGVEVSYIGVDKKGVIKIKDLENAVKDNTTLVSVMYVNSEIGTVQPIRDIGKIIKRINEKKENEWKKHHTSNRGARPRPIYFHTDATQAVNFFDCNTKYLHVDMLSMSGHKIYGPKGVGALFIKKGTPVEAVQLGGHQERNMRSGTYNVPGIVGLGKAIDLLKSRKHKKDNEHIKKLRDMLIDGIKQNIPNVILNTDCDNAASSHAHFSFPGAEGEAILISLDLKGIAVSTGSACASGSHKASHVLLAMGIKPEIAHTSIRFTLGKFNTEAEIKKVLEVLPPIIARLRKINPDYKK